MKRIFCLISAICVLLSLSMITVPADEVGCSARAYELYCADNASVLSAHNAGVRLPMASTTKIMTTLLTLEAAAVDNKVVTFSDDMTAEGSSMYLKPGEQVTLYDLAVGMMMQSGNDAANAAAIAISGSIGAFADLMNKKAVELGMTDTHFVTPSGLDDDDHYTTAHDMALLMSHALNNGEFADITSQTSMTVDFVSPPDKSVTYPNHNRLLRMYEGCIGGKTGYTDSAGRCLVTAARKNGMTLIAVTLDDRDDWDDHIRLYDYGFERYTAMPALIPDELDIVGGVSDKAALSADSYTFIVPKDKAGDTSVRLILPVFAYAPVEKGDVAGKCICSVGGEKIGEITISFAESVPRNTEKRSFITYIKDLFNWHS